MSELLSTLVIAEGLGPLSLQAGSRGFFQGSFIEKEYIGVALSSQIGDREPLVAIGSDRLTFHWSWVAGAATKKLVPWVAVKPGFAAALAAENISRANLTQWVIDGLPVEMSGSESLNICCIEPGDNGTTRERLLFLYGEKILTGTVHTIAAKPRLSGRLDGLAPIQSLQSKRVAIVGVGSGGSAAAVNLASAGVGKLYLFDKDKLSIDNLFRHACNLRHVGRAKVFAVRDLIASYDLPTEAVTHNQDVVEEAGDLWSLMEELDLVICATDSNQSRRLVNYISARAGIPLVMACTFRNASIGEIIRVRPGKSACYECTRLALSATGALQLLPDAEESARHVPYANESGSVEAGQEVNLGSRADVSMVAALLSRVAVSTLLSSEICVDELPGDYLVWGGRMVSDLTAPFNFERPFSTTWVHLERHVQCPVCADLGEPIDEEAAETYRQIMARVGAKAD